MTSRIILDLCGGTGAWSQPYKEAGYDVRIITLPEQDVRLYIPPDDVYGVLAAPPCTEFSFAKHYHGKGNYTHNFQEGLSIVDACIRVAWRCRPRFWALENPRGYLQRFLGKPSFTFDPWMFGDGYAKRTHLWGSFNMPDAIIANWQKPVIPEGRFNMKFCHQESKNIASKQYGKLTRQERRAITPTGFARAFFKANP